MKTAPITFLSRKQLFVYRDVMYSLLSVSNDTYTCVSVATRIKNSDAWILQAGNYVKFNSNEIVELLEF